MIICWIEEPFPKYREEIVISNEYNENEVNDEENESGMIHSKSWKIMGKVNSVQRCICKIFKNYLIHIHKALRVCFVD